MEDGEGERDVEDHTDETGSDTHVEAVNTLLLVDLREAVAEALILGSVNALHLCLNHVDWVVEHRGAESGKGTREQVNDDLDRDELAKRVLGVLEHDESDTLVGRLLQEGGHDTLVDSTEAVLLYDCVDTVEQVAVLGRLRELIVDQLGLQRLLRRDDDDSLGGTGAKTAEEVVSSVALSQDVLLDVSVGSESSVVLGHREHEEGAVTLVEAEHTVGLDGVLDDVDGTHGVLLFVELHDGLGVLGWVRARDLDRARDTSCAPRKMTKTTKS